MGQEYAIVYAAINAFCVVYALIVLSKLSGDMGSEREVMYLKRMILAYIVFAVTEAIWALGSFGVIDLPIPVLTVISSITMISVAVIALYWFAYGETKMGRNIIENTPLRIALNVPPIVLCVLYVISIFNGMMFHYDESGMFVQGPFYELSHVVDLFYLAAVSFDALIKSLREKSDAKRREYIMLLLFVVPPAIAGIIDTIHPNLPLIVLAVFGSILLVFTFIQESQIFNDALTGLNNRRRATAYLEELLANTNENHAFYLFILDVDLFKNINDKLGHVEGDRALVLLADSIRKTCQHYRSFVARWGGDEFVVIAEEQNIESPETMAASFKNRLAKECATKAIGYPLEVSIGWTRCADPSMRISDLIEQADTMLYEEKKSAHAMAAKRSAGSYLSQVAASLHDAS